MLRELVDPNEVNLRTNANKREDIFVACQSSLLVSYENLSKLNTDRQDAFCTILTGGGYAARTMRTNVDETVINVKRPVVLNGIANVVTNPDLLDRFISIELQKITTGNRKTEAELRAEFELKKGKIFGAILKRFSRILQKLPEVAAQKLELPRMSDFALLGEAMMQSMGKEPGYFLACYHRNQNRSVVQAIDSSPLGAAIVSYMTGNPGGLSGSYTQVGDKLRAHAVCTAGQSFRARDWPAGNGEFGTALRRLIPALERKGIRVKTVRKNSGFTCRITRIQ